VIYATADEGLAPRILAQVSPSGVPVTSLALAFVVGLLFLAPLPSWRLLVTYLSSIGVLAYGIGPVTLLAFRTTLPESEFPRPFRLPAVALLAPLAFIVGNLVVFWAGATITNHLFGGLLAAFILYCAVQLATHKTLAHLAWRGAWWLAPYFAGLWLITYLGPLHGRNILTNTTGAAAIALFSLVVIYLARTCAMPDPQEAKAALSK
jgi:amino acid transporter